MLPWIQAPLIKGQRSPDPLILQPIFFNLIRRWGWEGEQGENQRTVCLSLKQWPKEPDIIRTTPAWSTQDTLMLHKTQAWILWLCVIRGATPILPPGAGVVSPLLLSEVEFFSRLCCHSEKSSSSCKPTKIHLWLEPGAAAAAAGSRCASVGDWLSVGARHRCMHAPATGNVNTHICITSACTHTPENDAGSIRTWCGV